jgi:hypothetical protein
MTSLSVARALLSSNQEAADPSFVAQNNPFNPAQPAEASDPKTSVAAPASLGDRDILAGISSSVAPTGTIKLGDTQYLLFGQKKLKVGESISIVFQGTTYELQITGVDRTSYTLRLNQEEITKPIKPSK